MIKEFIQKLFGKKDPVELSYSRIQAYKRCPQLFKRIYMEGMRSSPNGHMSLGMSLHRALADFSSRNNADKTLDRLYQIYDEVWVNEGFSSTQETLDMYDAGRKMLGNFFEIHKDKKGEVIATEKDFTVALNGIRLMGSIDRIDKSPDGSFEIIEYKTQADNWSSQRIANDLQLTLYEIGAREGLGLSPVTLHYCFFSDGRMVTTRRTEEQRKSAMNLIFEIAGNIRAGRFDPNYSYCERCEFGVRCPSYRKAKETARI